jgi:Fe-S cluster assembly iron-binding protein IscA
MLTLSPSAVEAVGSLLQRTEVPADAGMRIGSAGESQFTLELVPEPAPDDQVIEQGDARVFVDSQAAPMLDNAQLDAHVKGDQVAFGLTSPGDSNGAAPGTSS